MSCSPQLHDLFVREPRLDQRFMLDRMTVGFLNKLREQQEDLKMEGRTRETLLLFDDLQMSTKLSYCYTEEHTALGFFTTRGRHYNVSCLYCAVSYVSVPKNFRRSLDILWLFSVPMSSDKKVLLGEYSRNPSFANFCINNLQQYESLVLDCASHRQELFTYRVPFQNTTPSHHDKTSTSNRPVSLDETESSGDGCAPKNNDPVQPPSPASSHGSRS